MFEQVLIMLREISFSSLFGLKGLITILLQECLMASCLTPKQYHAGSFNIIHLGEQTRSTWRNQRRRKVLQANVDRSAGASG